MTIPNPNTTRLKNNILRGVYDENLRINDARPDPKKAGRSDGVRSFIILAMALLVVGGSVLLFRLLPLSQPGKGLPSSPVAAAVQEFEPLPTTTVEVQVPVPVAVPTLTTANSFILQPPEASDRGDQQGAVAGLQLRPQ